MKTLNPIVKCALTGLTLGLLALVVIFGFVCTGCSKHEGTDVVSAPTEDCWTTKVVLIPDKVPLTTPIPISLYFEFKILSL